MAGEWSSFTEYRLDWDSTVGIDFHRQQSKQQKDNTNASREIIRRLQ